MEVRRKVGGKVNQRDKRSKGMEYLVRRAVATRVGHVSEHVSAFRQEFNPIAIPVKGCCNKE